MRKRSTLPAILIRNYHFVNAMLAGIRTLQTKPWTLGLELYIIALGSSISRAVDKLPALKSGQRCSESMA